MRLHPGFDALLVLAALLPMSHPAHAYVLSPGVLIPGPSGSTAAAEPQLAGTVVEDVLTPFSYVGWFQDSSFGAPPIYGDVTGTLQSRVVRSGDGSFDFYWRVSVDSGSFLPVLDFTVSGMAPATYNANWRSDGLGNVQPATISENLSGAVQWAFGQYIDPSKEIYPGDESYFLFLDSDARGYARTASLAFESGRDSGGSMMIQWGGQSGPYPTFAPAPPSQVPEPASGWLALASVGALALARRRKPNPAA